MTAEEAEAQEAARRSSNGADAARQDARDERENSVMKEVTELPILDAFGRPDQDRAGLAAQADDQLQLRRRGRHRPLRSLHHLPPGDRRSAPGSAVEPRYRARSTPDADAADAGREAGRAGRSRRRMPTHDRTSTRELLEEAYGLQIRQHGLFNADDAMVSVVRPETPARQGAAGNGRRHRERSATCRFSTSGTVYSQLLETVKWGQPVDADRAPRRAASRMPAIRGSTCSWARSARTRRTTIGCTICHDGQGSATAFKWASHSPNDPFAGQADWKREYGWFDNHHWIYPMTPNRFTESLCLKCHHDVTELEPSERFPDPPAPKLVEGFHLIQQYGCFGCHEINGFDGPNKRIGPDLRTEPPYSAAALALLAERRLDDRTEEPGPKTCRVAARRTTAARRSLTRVAVGCQRKLPGKIPTRTKKLVNLLDELETPGQVAPRRTQPASRGQQERFRFPLLLDSQAQRFPSLDQDAAVLRAVEHLDGKGLEETKTFEPIEIRTAAEYLLAKSQPFEYTEPPKAVTEKASADRGKELFEVPRLPGLPSAQRFPGRQDDARARSVAHRRQAGRRPNGNGQKWLYTWLRNPSKYHARTFMPNLILEPRGRRRRQADRSGGRHHGVPDDVAAGLEARRRARARADRRREEGPARLGAGALADRVHAAPGRAVS